MEKGLSDIPDTFRVRTNGKRGLHFGSISCLTRDVAPSDSLSLSDDGWGSGQLAMVLRQYQDTFEAYS